MIFSIDSFMRASNGKRKAKNAARDNRAQNSNCNSPAGNLVSFFLFWTFSKALLRERRAGTGKRKETVGGARRFDPFLFSPPFLPAAPVSRAEFLSSVRILTSRARRRSKTLDQIPPLRDDAARFAQMAFFLSARARRPCRPALCLAKPVFVAPSRSPRSTASRIHLARSSRRQHPHGALRRPVAFVRSRLAGPRASLDAEAERRAIARAAPSPRRSRPNRPMGRASGESAASGLLAGVAGFAGIGGRIPLQPRFRRSLVFPGQRAGFDRVLHRPLVAPGGPCAKKRIRRALGAVFAQPPGH